MVVRVTNVPNPAAGHDWTFTIPGQWNVELLAVTATLVTTANPASAPDASGNSRPLTYTNNVGVTYGVTGPFAGTPNHAVNQSNAARGLGTAIGTRAASTDWNTATISVGGFVKFTSALTEAMWEANQIIGGQQQGWRFDTDNSNPPKMELSAFHIGTIFLSNGVSVGAWHLVGCTYDGVTLTYYVDGAAAGSSAATFTVAAIAEPMAIGGRSDLQVNAELIGSMAGWFVNANVLAAGRWSTYYTDATTVGAAQYKADVLADAPLALWMMDDLQTQTSRTSTLTITDGTQQVGNYPGGTITGSAPSFQWTWSAQGSSLAQSPGAQVNLVAIPDLILPPGYTVGTRTLDLVSTDQWSNINVWFEDGTGPGGQPPAGNLAYTNVRIMG